MKRVGDLDACRLMVYAEVGCLIVPKTALHWLFRREEYVGSYQVRRGNALYTWVCLASATIPKVHGPILLCHTFLRFAFPAAVDGTSDNANLRQAGLEVQTPQQMQEEKGGGGEEEGNEEGKGNEVC